VVEQRTLIAEVTAVKDRIAETELRVAAQQKPTAATKHKRPQSDSHDGNTRRQ